ncbi:hypothetical protein Mapa_004063 [Marchantia paleacea]|nr:hypothetical protein Mapa_004063 [Marchantia paleacea]
MVGGTSQGTTLSCEKEVFLIGPMAVVNLKMITTCSLETLLTEIFLVDPGSDIRWSC